MVKRDARGIRLIEAIVVLGMLLFILAGVFLLLHSGQRYTRETEAYSAAQQQASSVVRGLTVELGQSVSRFTKYGPGYIIFLSSRAPETSGGPDFEFDPASGRLVWKKWVCYYHDATENQNLRAEIPLDTATADLAAEPTPVSVDPTPYQDPGVTKRIVGRGITNFTITGATGSAYDFEVISRVMAAVPAKDDDYKVVEITLGSRVTMLNEGYGEMLTRTRRGYVLITLILIGTILAVVAGALVKMGAGSLYASQRDYSGEQALFVGPGGNPEMGINADATSTINFTGSLNSLMNVPPIELPTVPLPDKGDFDDEDTSTTPVQLANTNFNPPVAGEMVITRNCLTLKIKANGDFTATESGPSSTCTGNIFDQSVTSANNEFSEPGAISFNPFQIRGNWHHVLLDPSTGVIGAEDFGPGGDPITSPPPPLVTGPMPGWMGPFLGGPPSSTTGGTLPEGTYDDVTIDTTTTYLEDGGTYVFKDLTINGNGTLTLKEGASNVNIYVTGSISIQGEDAIVNETRLAPNLNIFYTGSDPVSLSGGAQAFHTLTAPNADVLLEGHNASFFGAIIAGNLEVRDANFFFDVATQGVGTGMAGTHLQMVARVRP